MDLWKTTSRLSVAALMLLSAACASSSTVKSNKLASYAGGIKRLFVEASLGTALLNKASGDETAVFTSTLVDTLAKCGTQTQVHLKDALDLNNDAGQLIRQFNPDSILNVTWQSEKSGSNVPVSTVYILSLVDIKSKAVVWKAEVDFVSRWQAGVTLAGSVIGQMKQDGLIDASCTVPAAK